MSSLCDQADHRADTNAEINWRLPHSPWFRHLRKGRFRCSWDALHSNKHANRRMDAFLRDERILSSRSVVLIHPQMLGSNWCRRLIETRRHPTWLYLMDSGYFCARSYNHVAGEHGSCLRCLGGDWANASQFGCHKRPPTKVLPASFRNSMLRWAGEGRLKFLAQNAGQVTLARQHFGEQATVEIIGLWVADWDDVFPQSTLPVSSHETFDVVFHGTPVGAKGFSWAIQLAAQCPNLSFLFPCRAREARNIGFPVPPNATFRPMTWETGLREAVGASRIVLNPSLWSAPIEGALIKSMMQARAVAVVDEVTAYANEIPGDLVLRLPQNIQQAASKIKEAIRQAWRPSTLKKGEWAKLFQQENDGLLDRMLTACGDI